MKNNLLVIVVLFITTNLFAYTDSDLDGVADKYDKCKNTPLSDLVDRRGCTIKSLFTDYHYDIVYGLNYADAAQVSTTNIDMPSFSLRADFYYKNFYLQTYSSYYVNTDDNGDTQNGFYDTFVGGGYHYNITKKLFLSVGAGALLPTYDDKVITNNTDYKAFTSISYIQNNATVFGSYSYTIINDKDTNNIVSFQDTNAYSVGAGYNFSDKFYASGSYNFTNSVYKSVEDLTTASVYILYNINKSKYFTFNYAHGLSNSANDNSFSLLIGHYF